MEKNKILTNLLMRVQLKEVDWKYIMNACLPHELVDIVSEGFVNIDGCFLSNKLLTYCQMQSPKYFEDEIAFECFVNSIHIDDYVSEKFFEYSIIFTNLIIRKWNEEFLGKLNVIISLDDETFLPTIKFHLKREDVSWLDENNLDKSIQAILITTYEITIVKI